LKSEVMPEARPQSPATPDLIQVLQGRPCDRPPVWLMRQAGRYLPEYRELRAKADGFLDLCYSPAMAVEITLQPIRRFDFDAAILFADILVLPDALGQRVEFEEGFGPRLDAMQPQALLAHLRPEGVSEKFKLVFETVERVRAALAAEKALIGFCGAPWTVATYMAEGGGSKDQAAARAWAYREPETFQALIDLLVDVSADHLLGQVRAGARALQIFDSWAGSLPEDQFARWCIAPTKNLVARVKAEAPNVPVIGFPRGAGPLAERYAHETGIDAISCDTSLPLAFLKERLQSRMPVQGNLDPLLLLAGGPELDRQVEIILATLGRSPFVFNLGHGIHPETPIDHVARLVTLVKNS
jgi:uroporphyrinogen decarboxylase